MPIKENLEDFVINSYFILCKGRRFDGEELSYRDPIKVEVKIYKSPGSNMISSDVSDCKYNCGAHGDKCSAAVEGMIPVANCCYAFDLPRNVGIYKLE